MITYNPYNTKWSVPPPPTPAGPGPSQVGPNSAGVPGGAGPGSGSGSGMFRLFPSGPGSDQARAANAFFRHRFPIPQTEKFVANFCAKSTDRSKAVFCAYIGVYSQHFIFVLTGAPPPGAPPGTPAPEANIIIPITHIVTWERAAAQAASKPAFPPIICSIPPGPSDLIPDAVKIYTQDNRVHMFWAFDHPVNSFYSVFDPIWRSLNVNRLIPQFVRK